MLLVLLIIKDIPIVFRSNAIDALLDKNGWIGIWGCSQLGQTVLIQLMFQMMEKAKPFYSLNDDTIYFYNGDYKKKF